MDAKNCIKAILKSPAGLEPEQGDQKARFFNWANPGLSFFSFRLFNIVDSRDYIKFAIAGFEPRTTGIGSDRFTN